MDTSDAHLEEDAVDWTFTGHVITRLPCSGFADYLYSNRIPKDPAFANFSLRTTSSNVARGAAAGCKGCALIHDAVTTFTQNRLPLDHYDITLTSREDLIDSYCLKIMFFLNPVRKLVRLDWSWDAFGPNEPLSIKPLAASRPHSHLPDCTSSSETSRRLNQWLVACAETHPACQTSSETALPKRVLEIKDSRIYLREETRKTGKYACLSHCWGPQGPSLRLERSTHQRLASGVAVYQLPPTFRDAVSICMSIGIQFLWIDALCIKQDDADDWAQAVATMGDIYETSWITIAATGSSSSQEGIYSTVPEQYKARALRDHEFHVRENLPGFANPVHSIHEYDSWPLLRRAWVYQERQLSPRMIHFSQHQIFWACNSSFQSQDGWYPSQVNPAQKLSLLDWTSIVEEYSALQLSYESDRLPAIAAVVKRVMQVRPHDTYIAGMWKDTLIPDLFWDVDTPQARSSRAHRIPTWSWASASGKVRHLTMEKILMQSVQLLDVAFTYVGEPHMGQLEAASITLQGAACHLPDSVYADLRERILARNLNPLLCSFSWDISCVLSIDFDWQAVEHLVGSDHDLIVLFLCKVDVPDAHLAADHAGMILTAAKDHAFERVGFITLFSGGYRLADQSSARTSGEESGEEDAEDTKGAENNEETDDAKDTSDTENSEDDKWVDYLNTAHKGAWRFSATIPHIGAERVEIDDVDKEDEISRSDSDGDGVVSSFVSALPVQTFKII